MNIEEPRIYNQSEHLQLNFNHHYSSNDNNVCIPCISRQMAMQRAASVDVANIHGLNSQLLQQRWSAEGGMFKGTSDEGMKKSENGGKCHHFLLLLGCLLHREHIPSIYLCIYSTRGWMYVFTAHVLYDVIMLVCVCESKCTYFQLISFYPHEWCAIGTHMRANLIQN